MRQKISSITHKLRLPSVCVLCSHYHRNPFAVCEECYSLLPRIENACRYCALPLPDNTLLTCGLCIQAKPHFDTTITAYRFEEPLRTLLHQYKYHKALYLRTFLAHLMLESFSHTTRKTECLIPVPLHPKRLRERGFNQAVELAKLLSRMLDIPYEPHLCKKIIHTAPQVNLSGKERQKNLRNTFTAQHSSYQHVTLIDDLLTTGSTANELARVLKDKGVAQVDIWCCARTVS